jgi:putative DNA primase/helicase
VCSTRPGRRRTREAAARLAAVIDLAHSEPGVPVLPGELDTDPWLLNCLNGTLDLRSGELRPHRREDLLTSLAPVQFDPQPSRTLWLTTLGRGTRSDLLGPQLGPAPR